MISPVKYANITLTAINFMASPFLEQAPTAIVLIA